MKVQGWLFLLCGLFFAGVDVVYWFWSREPVRHHGHGHLGRLRVHDRLLPDVHGPPHRRPAGGQQAGEISDGAGEIGFFSPSSWWPLFVCLAAAFAFVGFVIGMWMS
ncbi:cytochrome c oxidase subunit 4 [Nonomuraea dietziae]|uniref:aa3-type cytochrome oxidase subunit IV n=1 Tax=Nonomuraea dietziae TaxID=65515 RepID=UPI0031DEABC6